MYRRMVVPLDGSGLAEQVLPYVRSLGRSLEAKVALLRVLDPLPAGLTDPGHGLSRDKVIANMRAQAQDYLEQVAASLRKQRLAVSYSVGEGLPAERIVEEAAKEPATLIAMSTHGRSGPARWLLGSVADKVLHATTDPLLLVRSRAPASFLDEARLGTIIVPLDGSTLAEQALPHVGALAKALNLKTVLVRVTPALEEYYRYVGPEYVPPANLPESVDADANAYLGRLSQKLRQERFPSVEVRLLHGDAAAAIVDLSQGVPDSLVAMTSHGRSGVGRWLLGSVADRIVRHATGPVLVIRAEGKGS